MRFFKIIFPLLCVFLLCGCWDYNELNMQELVLGVGIDETPSGISVTVQTAGGGGKEGAVYSMQGEGFFDAVRNATSDIGRKLYWGHCRLILFGEDAAKTRIHEVFDVISRSRDVYPNISVAIARNSLAKDIINKKMQTENATDSISDTLSNAGNSKRFSDMQLWEIMRQKSQMGTYVLPTVAALGGDAVHVGGGAVIHEDRLTGYLDDEEMLMYMLMTRSDAGGYLPPVEPKSGERVSLEILKNDVDISFERELAVICVRCVLTLGSGTTASDEELRRAAEKYLDEKGAALLQLAEEKDFGDIFGISDFAERKKASYLKTAVKFDVVINRAGMLREGEG